MAELDSPATVHLPHACIALGHDVWWFWRLFISNFLLSGNIDVVIADLDSREFLVVLTVFLSNSLLSGDMEVSAGDLDSHALLIALTVFHL